MLRYYVTYINNTLPDESSGNVLLILMSDTDTDVILSEYI